MPHYCKVCQTYKANEKFSGKGHNSHICKACKGKPLPKKEKPAAKPYNPFMKAIKIKTVIAFEYEPRMLILFKRGSEEFVAYREGDEPYQIFEFIRKEERFEQTTIFDKEMAHYAIDRKADFISIYVEEWADFENVLERVTAYNQTIDNFEEFDDEWPWNHFIEHYINDAQENEKLLLNNLYQLQQQLEEVEAVSSFKN